MRLKYNTIIEWFNFNTKTMLWCLACCIHIKLQALHSSFCANIPFSLTYLQSSYNNAIKCIKCIPLLTEPAIQNGKLIFQQSVSTQGFQLSFYKALWEYISLVCTPVACFISCTCVKSSNSNLKERSRLPYDIYTIWFHSLLWVW